MNLSRRRWFIFIILTILSLSVWYKLSYPQISFINLQIGKPEAIKISESFLLSRDVDPSSYLQAVIFIADVAADRYLQKTLGATAEEEFIRTHDYDLFSWVIRFFRENEKEEFFIRINSKDGQITEYRHFIEDTEERDEISEKIALVKAQSFLRDYYGVDFDDYEFHSQKSKKYDNRVDYEFSWEKKGVYIPWEQIEDGGGAKLIISATVSGDEIKKFQRDRLDIPEKFKRYIERQSAFGGFLSSAFFLIFLGLIAWSVGIVIKRKESLIIQGTWRFFLLLALSVFVMRFLDAFNNFQSMLFQYRTSSAFISFVGISFIGIFISCIFISLSIIMPGVAGESLRCETYPKKQENSLYYFISSTFLGRSVAKSAVFGYLVFFILLGIQSALFYFGQKYCGVWVEKIRLTALSSSYIPFLSAFVVGCSASITEETVFRIFAINWARKYLKSTVAAVIVVSVIWGFGHVQYPVYPVWFRGLEVSIIGMFLGFILLKYGIIPLFIAHYLFDVFWGVAPYVLGRSNPYLFYSSVFLLLIPLIFALIAYLVNRDERQRDIKAVLSSDQRYNVEILGVYIAQRRALGIVDDKLRSELISHGWDSSLVELAFLKLDEKGSV